MSGKIGYKSQGELTALDEIARKKLEIANMKTPEVTDTEFQSASERAMSEAKSNKEKELSLLEEAYTISLTVNLLIALSLN
jgi:hypothetical protein